MICWSGESPELGSELSYKKVRQSNGLFEVRHLFRSAGGYVL